MLDEAEDKDVK